MFESIRNFIKEIKDSCALFSKNNKKARMITFYSESDIYYQYYEGVMGELLKDENIELCYITSDINDSIFKKSGGRLKAFYIKSLLPFIMIYLDSKAFLMTMPDLGNYHIKRSINDTHYIYVFHAAGSAHLQYSRDAFNNYDAIFCVGAHHIEEIRKHEKLYGLKEKILVECGYHRLEKIYTDHINYIKNAGTKNERKTVLIAPTWGRDNIMDSCLSNIIDEIESIDRFDFVIRPHPEYIKRNPEKISDVRKRISKIKHISLELDMLKDENLHKADVLITDWSGIYLEYALGTERPVLFIETPCRIDNIEYKKLEIEPMELALRPKCGKILEIKDIPLIIETIGELIGNAPKYSRDIKEFRDRYLYNFLSSSPIAAKYIKNLL